MLPPLDNHPGDMFIKRYGPVRQTSDVVRYADFLREESGLKDDLPVDLGAIHRHFRMPPPVLGSLPGQQGVTVDWEAGLILLQADDPVVRQRFSNAHELMEMLFGAHEGLPHHEHWQVRFSQDEKEHLCDEGAAALLMPGSLFSKHLCEEGVCLPGASALAALFDTSFLAAILRMIKLGAGAHMMLVWRYCLKPAEIRELPSPLQQSLWAEFDPSPPRKWRVWWSSCSEPANSEWQYSLPRFKSIPDDSLIAQAAKSDSTLREFTSIDRVKGKAGVTCFAEAKRIMIGDELCIVSLLHLPGDDRCTAWEQPETPGVVGRG
jgi:hypothetical protein